MRLTLPLRLALLALLAAPGTAQVNEHFDAYALGPLDGQGGWHGWDGVDTTFANVVNTQSLSGAQSAELAAGADSVLELLGATAGQWTVTTQVYVPAGFVGKSYFNVLNEYNDFGPYEWSTQVGFNGDTGLVECDCGAPTPVTWPLVFDSWTELRADYDLDNDIVNISYGGSFLASYPISAGVFGADSFASLQIEAIDLYPDAITTPHVTALYYDDIEVQSGSCIGGGPPEPGMALCFGDGSGTPCPCGNNGAAGEGCANSTGSGANLSASGSPSVTGTGIDFIAGGVLPGQPGLLFQADLTLNGGNGLAFGDGLRCCGENVIRLETATPSGSCTEMCVAGTSDLGCGPVDFWVVEGGSPIGPITVNIKPNWSALETAKAIVAAFSCALSSTIYTVTLSTSQCTGVQITSGTGGSITFQASEGSGSPDPIPPSQMYNGQTFGATFCGGGVGFQVAPVDGGVLPGDTKCYQVWYRDPIGSPCGSGFNLTNAYQITWTI